MSEYVADDAALAEAIRAVTDLWDEPLDEVHDVPQIVNALLASGVVRPAADVRAEALEQAADALAERLDTFPLQGRHTRAGWAVAVLRDRAARLRAGGDA